MAWRAVLLVAAALGATLVPAALGAANPLQLQAELQGTLTVLGSSEFEDVLLSELYDNVYQGPAPYLTAPTPGYHLEAQSTADVLAAVQFALANGIKVSVLGNGHQQAAVALLEPGAFVIDVSGLEDVIVDPVGRTAYIEAGAQGLVVGNATIQYGLHFPVGHVAGVGISGFTLGGGLGWAGTACDRVIAFDVVNTWDYPHANVRIVRVNATSFPDLNAQLRGAGQNLAIVLGFLVELVPVNDPVPTFTAVFSPPFFMAGFTAFTRQLATAPSPYIDNAIIFVTTPQGPSAVMEIYAFDPAPASNAWAATWVQAANASGAVAVIPEPVPYLDVLVSTEGAQDYDGVAGYCVSVVVANLTADVFRIASGLILNATSPESIVGVFPNVPGDLSVNNATAYGWRNMTQIWVWAQWVRTSNATADGDATHIAWAEAGAAALAPYSLGTYINMATYQNANATRNSYPASNWPSIVAAKAKYDPANLLRSLDYYRANNGQSGTLAAPDVVVIRNSTTVTSLVSSSTG